jgi:hypothetical protein
MVVHAQNPEKGSNRDFKKWFKNIDLKKAELCVQEQKYHKKNGIHLNCPVNCKVRTGID